MQTYHTPEAQKERARAAMREMATRGDLPGCAPVGYRNVAEGYGKKVVVDEGKARLVRLAFGLAATTNRPLRDVLNEVTAYGLTSRNGKPLQATGLWRILTNPFYTGQITYGGELLPGNHRPLVTRELFEHVQENMRARRRNMTH